MRWREYWLCWRLVPVEPTTDMCVAALEASHDDKCSCGKPWLVLDPEDAWPAMLSASPPPPQELVAGEREETLSETVEKLRAIPVDLGADPVGDLLLDRRLDDQPAWAVELFYAARSLTFGAYPAHGSGFITRVDGDLERFSRALEAVAQTVVPLSEADEKAHNHD